MNILMGLNTQLEAINQTLSRAQQDKAFTEAMLAQQIAEWRSQKAPDNPKAVDDRLLKLQADLVAAEARYTSDHPDVVKLKKEIAVLKEKSQAQLAMPTGERAKPNSTEPIQLKQMRVGIYQLEQAVREKSKEQERLRGEIRKYEARVQLSPVVEEQFKALTRDYQTALGFYTDLLNKKTQSEMATDLERKQQGEQFLIMDPPNLPEKPSFPNRLLIALAGLAGGIGLGFGLAFLLEMRNQAIRTEDEVTFYLELPTLALVPNLEISAKGVKRARRGETLARA
jgi:uncharacterized protein involved in exopolysaccharide biosynthesis